MSCVGVLRFFGSSAKIAVASYHWSYSALPQNILKKMTGIVLSSGLALLEEKSLEILMVKNPEGLGRRLEDFNVTFQLQAPGS